MEICDRIPRLAAGQDCENNDTLCAFCNGRILLQSQLGQLLCKIQTNSRRPHTQQLQESFRKLFSNDENADASTATADSKKTPRRRFPKIKMPQMPQLPHFPQLPRRRPKAESGATSPKTAEEEKVGPGTV